MQRLIIILLRQKQHALERKNPNLEREGINTENYHIIDGSKYITNIADKKNKVKKKQQIFQDAIEDFIR